MQWYRDFPMAFVRRGLKLLPKVTAEESFLASTRVALGSGSLSQSDARKVRERWSRQMTRGARRAALKPSTNDMAAIGIAVVGAPVNR